MNMGVARHSQGVVEYKIEDKLLIACACEYSTQYSQSFLNIVESRNNLFQTSLRERIYINDLV